MAKKKKLSKIVDAVKKILGNGIKKKKLNKVKSLQLFIDKMAAKRKAIKTKLAAGGIKKSQQKEFIRHLKTLEIQIKKARKILKDMES